MTFHDPEILLFLPLLVPVAFLIRRRERHAPALPFPSYPFTASLPQNWRSRLATLVPYIRLLALALGILALARPQSVQRESTVHMRGVDLVIALDLSTSMLAEDLSRGETGENRLAMAKAVLRDFIKGRPGDRIALVAFAARPYPAAPLTLDHEWLQGAVERLDTGSIEDGTALGDAIVSSLNRLRDRPAASRAVIVVTDGRSNAGRIPPETAAAAARALGIRVHAVGIGSRGEVGIPVESPLGGTVFRQIDARLDEQTLRALAATTGGSYFRADDSRVLSGVFSQIDRLERHPIEEKVYFTSRERHTPLLVAALVLVCLEMGLRWSVVRRVP